MSVSIEPLHVSIADAARVLGITPYGCLELADSDAFETVTVDGRRLVLLSSLRAYAKSIRERA